MIATFAKRHLPAKVDWGGIKKITREIYHVAPFVRRSLPAKEDWGRVKKLTREITHLDALFVEKDLQLNTVWRCTWLASVWWNPMGVPSHGKRSTAKNMSGFFSSQSVWPRNVFKRLKFSHRNSFRSYVFVHKGSEVMCALKMDNISYEHYCWQLSAKNKHCQRQVKMWFALPSVVASIFNGIFNGILTLVFF